MCFVGVFWCEVSLWDICIRFARGLCKPHDSAKQPSNPAKPLLVCELQPQNASLQLPQSANPAHIRFAALSRVRNYASTSQLNRNAISMVCAATTPHPLTKSHPSLRNTLMDICACANHPVQNQTARAQHFKETLLIFTQAHET